MKYFKLFNTMAEYEEQLYKSELSMPRVALIADEHKVIYRRLAEKLIALDTKTDTYLGNEYGAVIAIDTIYR